MPLSGKPKIDPKVQAELDRQAAIQAQAEKVYREGIVTLRDVIAPSSIEIESNYIKLGKRYARTIFVYGYPRSLFTGWLSGLINID
jgi:hypothetical protein